MRVRGLVALILCIGLTGCGARQPGRSDENTSTSTSVKERADQARITADPSAAEAVQAAVRFVCSGQRLLDTPPTQLAEVIRSLWSASKADDAGCVPPAPRHEVVASGRRIVARDHDHRCRERENAEKIGGRGLQRTAGSRVDDGSR